MDGNGCSIGTHILSYKPFFVVLLPFTCDFAIYSPYFKMEAFDCEARRCEGLSRQALTGGTAMVATAPPEGLLASETEPPWALAASEAAWRPSP